VSKMKNETDCTQPSEARCACCEDERCGKMRGVGRYGKMRDVGREENV